jgi:hypothetical protein
MQSKQPLVIVIRYVLMIKGLGYNTSYYRNMNIYNIPSFYQNLEQNFVLFCFYWFKNPRELIFFEFN